LLVVGKKERIVPDMHRRKLIICSSFLAAVAACFFVCPAVFSSPQASVEARVNRSSAGIGEPIRYSVAIFLPEGHSAETPDLGKIVSKVEKLTAINNGTTLRPLNGGAKRVWWCDIASYSPGEYTIPETEIAFTEKDGTRKTLISGEVKFLIKGVVPEDLNTDFTVRLSGSGMAGVSVGSYAQRESSLRSYGRTLDAPVFFRINEIKKSFRPVSFEKILRNFRNFVYLIFGLFLLFFLIRRLRRKKTVHLTPLEEFLSYIERTDVPGSIEKGHVKELVAGLDRVFRAVIKMHLGLTDNELTTTALIAELKRSSSTEDPDKDKIIDVLVLTDKVKYSGYVPGEEELVDMFEKAKRVVGG
jgi:hypothetical protein